MSMVYREWPTDHSSNVDVTSFQQWRDRMESENPQYQFWSIVLKLEMVSHVSSVNSFCKFFIVSFLCRRFCRGCFLFDHYTMRGGCQ